MAEIVNLNRERKAKAGREKAQAAAANRVRFGRTKAERKAEEAERALAERRLDDTKRET